RAFSDVVLKDVYELVAEDVLVLGVDAGERHDHARPLALRLAADSFLELLADDVRLLEVRLVGVEDQLLAIEGVPEGVRVARVPPLGHPGGVSHGRRFGRIEKVVEVIRLEDAPVEILVLDFVAPEVVLGAGRRGKRKDGQRYHDRRPAQRISDHEGPAERAAAKNGSGRRAEIARAPTVPRRARDVPLANDRRASS